MCDHYVFMKNFGDNDIIILLLYIHDILIVGHDVSKIDNLKKELSKSLVMKDLGPIKLIFHMKIFHDRKTKK